VQPHKLARERIGYFWVRPRWAAPPAVRHGKTCPVTSSPLGTNLAVAIERANALNEAFKQWREGEGAKLTPGTVQWLFDWYRQLEKFTELRHNTRAGYRIAMDAVEAMAMKAGTFGQRRAAAVDATVADTLYRKAREKHGERQGAYMMQVCRLVWNQASRHHKATGIKANENPFSGMGIKSSSGTGRGNRAATRAEYDAYRAATHALGRPSMAVAAAICFEVCQRVYDAFGYEDPDRRIERGIRWGDYVPGVSIGLVQSKTGNVVTIPLADGTGADRVELYPELEAELARLTRGADSNLIVRDERTGDRYTKDYVTKLHRRIAKAARLDPAIKFTSFRHGGITEIGDSGTDDVRAVSGHSTLDVTRIYNKANEEKAVRIATRRRDHIKLLASTDHLKEGAKAMDLGQAEL